MPYHGDGQFFDRGFFHYPRYVSTFPDIELSQPGEHRFQFSGLPNEKMSLVLVLKSKRVRTPEEYAQLTNLQVRIEAALTDEKGQVIRHADGTPAPTNENKNWVLARGETAEYWHHQCIDVRVHQNQRYDLMIRVSSVAGSTTMILATPSLEGGGLELP